MILNENSIYRHTVRSVYGLEPPDMLFEESEIPNTNFELFLMRMDITKQLLTYLSDVNTTGS